MSSKPTGDDPRILQKTGETVYIASTTRQSKGRKYHKEGCKSLERIKGGANEVDLSVVKWKGYKKCVHCHDLENNEHAPIITGPEVDRVRRALVNGYNAGVVAEGHDYARATVRYHARAVREYNYNEHPEYPAVEYKNNQWVWSE